MTVDQVYVVAGHFNEFRRYCRDSGLNVPRQARFVRDGSSLRGVAGPIEVVWLEGAFERVDFDELRAVVAEINRSEVGIPKAAHRLNRIGAGDRFRINDENFVLIDVHTDLEGCLQLTLARAGSICHRASEVAPPRSGQSREFNQVENLWIPPMDDEGTYIRGQLPTDIAKTLQAQGLPDVIDPPYVVPPSSVRFQYGDEDEPPNADPHSGDNT